MNSDDEQGLRQHLGTALDTITPSPAPVGTVIRKGRARRTRRHIAVAAGLAAGIGIGMVVPSLLHQIANQPPTSPTKKPTVTVNPIGAGAPSGLIGAGTVNGKRWRLVAQRPNTGLQCFQPSGAVTGSPYCSQPLSTGGEPVGFDAAEGGSHALVNFGPVESGVSEITVTFANGTVLVLQPVEAFGQRYVAFAAPPSLAIDRIVAYSGHKELSYTIPPNTPSGLTVGAWLRPGQRGLLARGTYKIGSGETVYVGPWGYCISGEFSECLETESRSLGNEVTGLGNGPDGAGWVVGHATAAVDHVRVHLTGGAILTARAVRCGGPKFFAFVVPKGDKPLKVDYYSASGHLLAIQSALP